MSGPPAAKGQTETDGNDHDDDRGRLGVVEDVPHAENRHRPRRLIAEGERADTANHSRSAALVAMPAMTNPM